MALIFYTFASSFSHDITACKVDKNYFQRSAAFFNQCSLRENKDKILFSDFRGISPFHIKRV